AAGWRNNGGTKRQAPVADQSNTPRGHAAGYGCAGGRGARPWRKLSRPPAAAAFPLRDIPIPEVGASSPLAKVPSPEMKARFPVGKRSISTRESPSPVGKTPNLRFDAGNEGGKRSGRRGWLRREGANARRAGVNARGAKTDPRLGRAEG